MQKVQQNKKMEIDFSSITCKGILRQKNEDYYLSPRKKGKIKLHNSPGLFAVADGLGGHVAGNIASKMACDDLHQYFKDTFRFLIPQTSKQILLDNLAEQFFQIDKHISSEGLITPQLADMGTTLSTMIFSNRFGLIAHVGDSRIYRLRFNVLEQLTVDHTFVQDMIRYGEITLNKAKTHPFRNMLTHVMGTPDPLVKTFLRSVKLKPGDRFLICTDGLHSIVSFKEIQKVMIMNQPPENIAKCLFETVDKTGRKDDVTMVVLFINGLS